MYRSHFKTNVISWKVLKLLCNNFQNIGFEIVLKEVLEISLLRNYLIKWGNLATALLVLFLASYIFACVSPTAKKSTEITIPETSIFESILQYNRVYIYAAKPPWTKAGVSVQKGDKVLIFASEEATIKTVRNKPPYNFLRLKIGSEGIPGPAVLFDNQRYFKPHEIGKLMLAVNRWHKNNTGGYLVDLFVIPEEKEELLLETMQELSLHNPQNHKLKKQIKKFIELHQNLFFTDADVTSSPSNASVNLDGFYRGKTPLKLRDLKLHRTYEICLRKEGYPDFCYSLNPKKSNNLFVELKKEYERLSSIPKELAEAKSQKDKNPPVIDITFPTINSDNRKISLSDYTVKISGNVEDQNGVVWVKINGQDANLDANGKFWLTTYLAVGSNKIEIQALDTKNNLAKKLLIVERSPVRTGNEIKSNPPISVRTENIDFGSYSALIIGNNNYQYLPLLKTAQNDAKKVANTLKDKYGFEVNLLLDAKRSDILLALNNLRLNLTNHDNLLIYYAGHGWLDKEADEGYWLPVNAQKDNMLAWISNSSITSSLRALKAKHVLIVADSCYSGKLARGIHIVKRTPGYLSRLSRKRVRSVISSGGLEPVIDSGGRDEHSVFASAFLDTLRENNDIMDGAQLFNILRRPVMLNSDQTPEYSDLRKAGHDGGEFLFVPVNN